MLRAQPPTPEPDPLKAKQPGPNQTALAGQLAAKPIGAVAGPRAATGGVMGLSDFAGGGAPDAPPPSGSGGGFFGGGSAPPAPQAQSQQGGGFFGGSGTPPAAQPPAQGGDLFGGGSAPPAPQPIAAAQTPAPPSSVPGASGQYGGINPAANPAAPAQAPKADAAPVALKAGWTDAGNGMVKDASGQMVPMNHPIYQNAAGAATPSLQAGPVSTGQYGGINPAANPAAPAAAPKAAEAGGLKAGWTDIGNNMVRDANGQVVDRNHPIYLNSGGAAAPAGTPAGTPASTPAPTSLPGVPPTPDTPPGQTPAPTSAGDALLGQATVGGAPEQGQQATVGGAFQQALLNRLAPEQVSANSAELQPAIQANRLSEQRGMERARAMAAERAAAGGYSDSGAFDSQLMGLNAQRAQNEGQYAGNLVNDLNKQRSAEGMATQQLVGGLFGQQDQLGSAERMQGQQLSSAERMAAQDAQVRREGLATQGALGQGDLALRDRLGTGNLNLGLAGLLQNGQQFGQSLASNNAQFDANLNQNALLQLLGGLG